jgi:LuxR family maltose regulon positive regulatory protein
MVELAKGYAAVADADGLKSCVRSLRNILGQRTGLGVVADEVERLQHVQVVLQQVAVGGAAFTRAELRLLPWLRTHLSFEEIGQELHVSRHTVKSQAISIYRKLGASSRSDAIARVGELGVLAS